MRYARLYAHFLRFSFRQAVQGLWRNRVMNIAATVNTVRDATQLSVLRSALVSAAMCYVLCGAVGLALLPWLGRGSAREWLDACPFAGCWLGAMILFFACIGQVGPLYGNILQSTRGLISILMGAVLARMGLIHLERRTTRGVFVQRLVAGGLMVAAIALFVPGFVERLVAAIALFVKG